MPPFSGTSFNSVVLEQQVNCSQDTHYIVESDRTDISDKIMLTECPRKSGRKPQDTKSCYRNASECHGYQDWIAFCGRRQSEDKRQKVRTESGSNGGGSSNKNSNRGSKGFENNSSSSGGNSGADGNGEDNDGSDDDDSYDYEEEDEDYEEEDDEDDDEEYDQDDEDDNDNAIVKSKPRSVKQEREKEMFTDKGCQKLSAALGNASLLDNTEGPQQGLKSLHSSTESSLAPVQPGTPVVLQGFICHETVGGVLVVNIQWRNKNYYGSLIDSSQHSWATPRFEESSCSADNVNSPLKGGKSKKLRDSSLASASAGHSKGGGTVHATPLKHKLRGRKHCHGNSDSKSSGLRGKKKSRNHDDESDDGVRPGKRSCTLKTRGVSPQPSPTLIECPEPNCNKKYKHINGLRYHQAHAHLEPRSPPEETNPSDNSTSASPSPIEEFKEPDTKSTGRWKSSTRSGARSRSVSPFTPLSTSASTVTGGNTSTVQAGKTIKGNQEISGARATKNRKSPCTTLDEQKDDSVQMTDTQIHNSKMDKAVKIEARKIKEEQDSKEEQESKEEVNDMNEEEPQGKLESKLETSVEEINSNTLIESCVKIEDETQAVDFDQVKREEVNLEPQKTETEEVVWETVIDSGRGIQGGPDGVNIEDAIDVGQEEGIISIKKGASLLGIEVEDISENEEEIDPGNDDSYSNKDGFLPIESQRELHYKSFVGVHDHSRSYEFESVNSSKSLKSIDSSEGQQEDYRNFNLCSSPCSSDIKIIKPKGQKATLLQPSLVSNSDQICPGNRNQTDYKKEINKSVSEASIGVSIESLVAKSMSRSAVEPPLTNADSPADRYKSYKYRSFGDKSCSPTLHEQNLKSGVNTTLAPVRQLETVSHSQTSLGINSSWKETVSCSSPLSHDNSGKADLHEEQWSERSLPDTVSITQNITNKDTQSSTASSSSSHSTDSANNYLVIDASGVQHRMSPKILTNVFDSHSALQEENMNVRSSLSPHRTSPFHKPNMKSESSLKAFNKQLRDGANFVNEKESSTSDSKDEDQMISGTVKLKENTFSKTTERLIPEIQLTPNLDNSRPNDRPDGMQRRMTPKDEDRLYNVKSSSQLFSRQLPTLPRHSRLTVPQLPVGVARPYNHGNMEQEEASFSNQERPSHSITSTGENITGDIEKTRLLKKPVVDKNQDLVVGEVLSVGARRSMPAIHAGLPSVVPATAHALNTRSSPGLSVVHSAYKAMKSSQDEDQVMQEAKGESAGSEYAGRPMASDKEQPVKKALQTAVFEGSSAIGTSKGKTSARDIAADFDGTVRKKEETRSWMHRDDRPCERPHMIEPDAQQVERLTADQLKFLQQQVGLQQIYHPFAQGNLSMEMVNQLISGARLNPQIQMLQECRAKQEREKERSVGKSTEEAMQDSIQCKEKQKSLKSKDINQTGSPSSTKTAKGDSQRKPLSDSYVIDSHQDQRGMLSTQAAIHRSGDLAVKNISGVSFDEPPEKKPKISFPRNDKNTGLEEILQKELMQQKLSMFKQLESDQAQQLPKKHHISGPEMKDSQLTEIDEDLADVKAARKEGLVGTPRKDKSLKSLRVSSKHQYGAASRETSDKEMKQDSRSQKRFNAYDVHQRPNSLHLPSRSPRKVHNKDVLEQGDMRAEERCASAPVPSNFVQTGFPANFQHFQLDPNALLYQQQFVPGLLMGVPVMSSGSTTETSSSPMGSLSRENQEEATHPRRAGVSKNQLQTPVPGSRARSPRTVNSRGLSPGFENRHHSNQEQREHSPRPLGNRGPSPGPDDHHRSIQDVTRHSRSRSPRPDTSRGPSPNPEGHRHGNQGTSRDPSPRIRSDHREKDHAKLLPIQEGRFRTSSPQSRHFTDSRDRTFGKSPSLSSADHHFHRSGVISNNLVVRRGEITKASGIASSQLEEEIMRKQRAGAEYGEAAKLGYIVYPGVLDSSPYSQAGIPHATSRHTGSATGRYHDNRK